MARDTTGNFDGIPLFASLSKAERDELARQCRFKLFEAGEHIIDSESDSRDVYFIVEGVVRVVNYSASGREVALDDIGAGGYFGELAALDGGPRSAYVMPHVREAVTAAMPAEVFLDAVERKPGIGLAIMKRLARIVRQSTERIMDLSTLGANNRVHAELLRQAWLNTMDGQKGIISPIPLHADIASRVSTTRETVARVLNDLARAGILERKKDALVVLDMARLATLVEDVRGY
jgi:CRP/FNR family transcriptional regulator, cyclic AMP receptor protein